VVVLLTDLRALHQQPLQDPEVEARYVARDREERVRGEG
jgi:hypothetical protein